MAPAAYWWTIVDGAPLDDVALLQDASRVLLVMRDGLVHKRADL